MQDQVRVGMIGTSWYADMIHLPFLKGHPGAVTAAICGRNRQRAEEMAAKYDIPQVFTDYRDMLREGELDAVIIAVPDDMHYPMTMAALDASLHVLCEKPMAFNLEQAGAMLAKAEAAGVKHMTCFTYRWMPYVRYLCQLLHDGYIGKCYDAQFVYLSGFAREADHQWKWDRQHGLGALGDLGSHMIDLALLTLGDIVRVQATLRVDRPQPAGKSYEPANDSANLTVQFADGALGTIQVSAMTHVGDRGQEQRVVLHGENGTIEVEDNVTEADRYTVRGLRSGEPAFQILPIPGSILAGVDQHAGAWDQFLRIFSEQSVGTRLFVDSILEDKAIRPSFYDGMKAQAVIEAAFESDRNGCWVDVAPMG